jgi:hypothetical protein
MIYPRFRDFIALLLLFIIVINQPVSAQDRNDAGMWLLPQLRGPVYQSLQQKGLELPESAFDTQQPNGLNRAIVRINVGESGGGTGSFVSSKGLVITNHHVAYDAIASLSSAEQNYLKEGFAAKNTGEELGAEGFSLYIPIEQVEVSQQLSMMIKTMQAQDANQALEMAKQQLVDQRMQSNPDILAEIDEYWAGNRQFMSVYRIIRDVRLVFAPPSSIGKFGGDIDNWMWPRHTGDFTFLRAWVAPDGSSRPFHPDNVPYEPDRYLQVSDQGFQDEDFTMIMGFPGTTYRHESSYHFKYYQESQHPTLIRVFRGIMAGLEAEAALDPELEVLTASDRASYANSLKYFEGVHQGFFDYDIVNKRIEQEKKLEEWIAADLFRQTEYGDVMPLLKRGYENLSRQGALIYAYVYVLNNSPLLETAGLLAPAYALATGQRKADAFTATEADSIRMLARAGLEGLNIGVEFARMKHFLTTLALLPDGSRPDVIEELFGGMSGEELDKAITAFLDEQMQTSVLTHPEKTEALLNMEANTIDPNKTEPFIQLHTELLEGYFANIQAFQNAGSFMNEATKKYVKAMLEFRNDPIEYPDANFTLRFTGGRIVGVSVRNASFGARTYLDEILPKYTGVDPFDIPEVQMKWINERQNATGRKAKPSAYSEPDGRLVVNFLSSNDITGGNSGSPIMNAKGEIIGVAFDGLIEGVVGDYFHDPKISRTINVDMRYILHVTEELYGLNHLIKEMGLSRLPADH